MLDDLLQRMSGVLQRYGVDPKDLSQQQLYRLALVLQLMQAEDKAGTAQLLPLFLFCFGILGKMNPNAVLMHASLKNKARTANDK